MWLKCATEPEKKISEKKREYFASNNERKLMDKTKAGEKDVFIRIYFFPISFSSSSSSKKIRYIEILR